MTPTRGELWLDWAKRYVLDYRLSVIPTDWNKKPSIYWKEYQTRLPTIKELESWPRQNLAVVTGKISRIVVVDLESRKDSEWFWKNRGKPGAIVKTRRGFHFWFAHPGHPVSCGQRIEKRYDIKGDGGNSHVPPSKHAQGEYEWVMPLPTSGWLPEFCPEWRPDTPLTSDYDQIVRNGEAYISRIRAVSGNGGHNDTYRAAGILKKAGYSEVEAFVAMQVWNRTNAEPPWSDRELLHKVRDAYR